MQIFNGNYLFLILFLCLQVNGKNLTYLYKKNLDNINNTLDRSKDECENFFQHACGNYKANNINTPVFLQNIQDRFVFFETSLQNFSTIPGEALRDLYESCKQRTKFNVIQGQPKSQRIRMFEEIDFLQKYKNLTLRWPMLPYQWQQINWNFIEPLEFCLQLEAELAAHGLFSLFQINFAEGTIYMEPSKMEYCHKSVQEIGENIKKFMHPHRSMNVANNLAISLKIMCQNLLTIKLNQDEFQQLPDINEFLYAYFETFFMRLNISHNLVENARKIPIDPEGLQRVMLVLQKHSARDIFNFILWNAFENLLYADCYQLTEEFEILLWSEYWNWNVFNSHFERDVAMASFSFHHTRFQRLRRQSEKSSSVSWDTLLLGQTNIVKQQHNLERQIKKFAADYLNLPILETELTNLQLKATHFYGNLLKLRLWQKRKSFFQAPSQKDIQDLRHSSFFVEHFFNYCITLIHQPLFHYFSTQSFDLWHSTDLHYSMDEYFATSYCIRQQSSLEYNATDERTTNLFQYMNNEDVLKLYKFVRAFQETQADYEFWLAAEAFPFAENFVLAYYGLDTKRILFYAVAQLYCGRNDMEYSRLINRSFMNIKGFEEAFKCSETAIMNPAHKCAII